MKSLRIKEDGNEARTRLEAVKGALRKVREDAFTKAYQQAIRASKEKKWTEALGLYQKARGIGFEDAPEDLEESINNVENNVLIKLGMKLKEAVWSNYLHKEDVVRVSQLAGIAYIGVNKQGYLEYKHRQTGIIMVLIPSRSFNMGSPAEEKDRYDNEGPVHEVSLDAYLIGKYEVTQEQWEKVMGNNPSYFKGPKNPVEQVSWEDCQKFCRKTGLSLPTEAQWERAARAGTGTRFYWGDDNDYRDINEYAWYGSNSGSKTHPVGEKRPNGFGLYDMSGNVWEWCMDWDGNYTSGKQSNPTGPSTGSRRVIRGGSWGSDPRRCRPALRGRSTPGDRVNNLGFRCAASSLK